MHDDSGYRTSKSSRPRRNRVGRAIFVLLKIHQRRSQKKAQAPSSRGVPPLTLVRIVDRYRGSTAYLPGRRSFERLLDFVYPGSPRRQSAQDLGLPKEHRRSKNQVGSSSLQSTFASLVSHQDWSLPHRVMLSHTIENTILCKKA